jgi:Tol biopolymer transport system component
MKISSDGKKAEIFSPEDCDDPSFSPDGSMIACSKGGELVIRSASNGGEIERHKLPAFSTANFGAAWLPDASGLIVILNEKNSLTNLLVLPRDGRKPYKLTHFQDGTIYRYAFSHDGSKLYLARGYPTQDAILIRDFR